MKRPTRTRFHRLGQIGLSLLVLTAAVPLAHVLLVRAFERDVGALAALAHVVRKPGVSRREAKREAARFEIDLSVARGRVDPRFLSVSIDMAQVVGGRFWSPRGEVELTRGSKRTQPFDFARTRLLALARALAPAYLRIGGTEADFVHYDLSGAPAADGGTDTGHAGERAALAADAGDGERTLTRALWDSVARFSQQTGLELFFTANAGRLDRVDGAYTGRHAEQLMAYSAAHGQRVAVWELGNEVNAFWLTLGPLQYVSAARYASDLGVFSRLVRRYHPSARIAAGAVFMGPRVGEPMPRLLPELTRTAGPALDVITWHYYPKQSRRCPLASRRARPGALLSPDELDEGSHWADYVTKLRDQNAPRAETWLGETGGAQCGGEPGDSDRFASSLWWLDQLGSAARAGQRVVVRQTLAGSDYGLLDERNLEPRPDFVASLLWKRTMGERVLSVSAKGTATLRAYAHCTAAAAHLPSGAVSVLIVNAAARGDATAALPEWAEGPVQLYRVTAPSLSSSSVLLNGRAWRLEQDEPALPPERLEHLVGARLAVPAASYLFAVFPEARAAACAAVH